MDTMDRESDDLRLHVALCEQRHRAMSERLKRVEWIGMAILGVLLGGGAISVNQLQAVAQAVRIEHQMPYNAPPPGATVPPR